MVEFFEFVNSSLKIVFWLSVPYLTAWVLFLQCLYYLDVLKMFQSSILLLTIIVSIFGFIMAHIYPKKIYFPILDITLSKTPLKLHDLIFHQIPLLIFIFMYDSKIKNDNLIFGLSVLVIYMLLFDPFKVYSFVKHD